MIKHTAVAVLRRAWASASSLGVDPAQRAQARAIMGANHFLILAGVLNLPWVVVLHLVHAPGADRAALTHVGTMAVWGGCLLVNRWRRPLLASVVALSVAVVQYAFLTVMFSQRSGFALPMLATGALTFAMLTARQWGWRLTLAAAATATVAVLMGTDVAAVPRVPVSEDWLAGAMVGNVTTTAAVLFVIAWFNDYYFLRERRRNDLLLLEARVAAQTDSLTEVSNRRGVAPVLARAVKDDEYALALADLDRFKRINDRLGHGAGDVVLANVARTLVGAVGADGVVARWGGEEFLVVMPGVDLTRAIEIMERARQAVEDEYGDDGVLEHVTMSVGVAHAPRGTGKERTLRAADALLYDAKASGRNLVLAGEVQRRPR